MMSNDLWIAIGAIAAAGISSSIAYVNLVSSKEQNLADFRFKWIEKLSEELGTLVAAVDLLLRLVEVEVPDAKRGLSPAELKIFRNAHKHEYMRLNESFFRVRIRLNPQTHLNLLDELDKLREGFYGSCSNLLDIQKEQKEVVRFAQEICGDVWERIREGDVTFQKVSQGFSKTAMLFIPSVVTVLLLMMMFMLFR
jgi:hypothetical protein